MKEKYIKEQCVVYDHNDQHEMLRKIDKIRGLSLLISNYLVDQKGGHDNEGYLGIQCLLRECDELKNIATNKAFRS